jgi:rod shape-determining protein MreC
MESFFSRYKNPLVLVLLLLGQFVLLAVQVRPQLPGAAVADHAGVRAVRLGVASVVAPPEKVVHAGGLGLRDLWSSYLDLVDVKQQNEALAARNQQLQLEESALAEDARQGERLQELLAFKQHYVDSTVPAQVIGTGGSDHGRTLIIDKGAEDGIAVDMPVITPDGIVGKIREVNPHSSEVLEISDPNSAAGVLLEETRTRGILSGDGSGRPEIVNLMPDDRIQKGQLVLTSGGDQIFPRGLPVGVVEKVVPDYLNQPLVDVILKPAANLSRLEEVLVVTATSSTLTPKMKHDLARSEGTANELKAAASVQAAATAEAALEAQRASDILAQRLPSASAAADPDAPDSSGSGAPATANVAGAPLHPPSALHPDHYTPGDEPPAQDMTPGARLAPYAQDTAARERAAKAAAAAAAGDESALPSPSVSPAFRAAHDAALAARPHPPVLHPPVPHATQPAVSAPTAGTSTAVTHATNQPGKTDATARAAAAGAATAGTPRVNPAGAPHAASSRSNDYGIVGDPAPHAAPRAPAIGTGEKATGAHVPKSAPSTPGSATPPATRPRVQTQIITDGPLSAAPRSQPRPEAGTSPKTTPNPATQTPKRRGPVVVPDDGSRPPRQTTPPSTPQASPQELR